MGTKVNSNYEDLLTFTRASKGHALRPVSYGDELVTNGTFDDSSHWTAESQWSIANGVASFDDTANGSLRQQIPSLQVGKLYQLSFEIVSGADANLAIYSRLTNVSIVAFTDYAVGTHKLNFVWTGDDGIRIVGSKFQGSTFDLDNVSLKEVLFDQPDGTLTLFEHPDNVPRVEYDADGNRLGLLVEEQRTNLLHYSEDFSQSYWNKTAATISTDVTTAPDGTTTADKLVVNNATADTEKFVNRNIYAYVNQTVTGSVFLKKAEYTWVQVNLYNLSSNPNRVWVNLDTGAVGTNLSSIPVTVTDVGNGWYRVALTATIQQVGNAFMTVAVADADGDLYTNIGDEESGTFLWGAQLEAGAFPTSYIKTTGSTATRSVDVASIPVADFGWNNKAGTVVAEVDTADASSFGILWSANADSFQNRTLAYINNDLIYMYNRKNNGVEVNDPFTNAPLDNTLLKHGYAFTDGDFNHTLNGATVESVASNEMPVGINSFDIGNRLYTSGGHLNGHIKSIKYYPRRLTDAQLQALTEPRSDATLSLTFDGLESSFTENYIHG